MAPDLRYHLMTLIVVLCAVIVGVVIGAHLTDPNELKRREARLNTKVDNAIKESREVSAAAALARQEAGEAKKAMSEAVKALLPAVLKGRLAGKRVALMHTGGIQDLAIKDTLISVLQMAGAEVASVTAIERAVAEDTSPLQAAAEQLGWTDDTDRIEQFMRTLAAVFAAGDTQSAIPVLAKAKVIRIGSDYTRPVHMVVVVGGADDRESRQAESLDRPLVKALLAQKLTVVGCETEPTPLSFVPEYTRLRIPTVDNVDSWSGQVALVLALAGQRGHYGVKTGASSKLPPLSP